MGLGDFKSALAMRDVIRSVVNQEINKARPGARLAYVYSIDPSGNTCQVVFPGDPFDSSAATARTPAVKPTKSFVNSGQGAADVVTVEKHPTLGLVVQSIVKGNPISQAGVLVSKTPPVSTLSPNVYMDANGKICKTDPYTPPVTTEDPWHTLPYSGNWTPSSGYPAQYRIDTAGNVHTRGVMNYTGTMPWSDAIIICTLPTGYRPVNNARAIQSGNTTAATVRLNVNSSGTMQAWINDTTRPSGFHVDMVFSAYGGS